MTKKYVSEDELMEILRKVTENRQLSAWAKTHAFSAPFISLVLAGERPLSERVCRALGYQRKDAVYERIDE
jgi:hypothetical protein